MVTNTVTDSDETAKNSTDLKVPPDVLKFADSVADELDALLDLPAKTAAKEDDSGPPTDRYSAPPRLALRHDGSLLIEITSDIPETALEGREITRYATLSEAEASDARDAAEEGCSIGASKVAWYIVHGAKKG